MKLEQSNVLELLEEVFKQESGTIKLDTPLEEFAKDSMDVMEFVAILKSKHAIEIDPEAMAKWTSAKDVVDYVLSHQ